MLAVYDFIPSYCPNCGAKINLKGKDPHGFWRDADYNAGASYQCDCGLMYQRTHRESILVAADSYRNGDLREHA